MSLFDKIRPKHVDNSKPIFDANPTEVPEGGPVQIERVKQLGEVAAARAVAGDRLAEAGVMRGGAAQVAQEMAIKKIETGEHQVVPPEAFDTDKQVERYRQVTGEHQIVDPAVLAQNPTTPPDHQLHA